MLGIVRLAHGVAVRTRSVEAQAGGVIRIAALSRVGLIEVDHAGRIVLSRGFDLTGRVVDEPEQELAVFERTAFEDLVDLRVDVADLIGLGDLFARSTHGVAAEAERQLVFVILVGVGHGIGIRAGLGAVALIRHRVAVVQLGAALNGFIRLGIELAHRVLDGVAAFVGQKVGPLNRPLVALVERGGLSLDRREIALVVDGIELHRNGRRTDFGLVVVVLPDLLDLDSDLLGLVRVGKRERIAHVAVFIDR